MTQSVCNNPDILKAAIRKIAVGCIPVLIAAGCLMSPAPVSSQDDAAYPPLQCSACSPLANQNVVGDRSIVPFKIYAVRLKAGSHLDVVASGGAETVGRFDLSLYGPQTGEFDFDHATCLARAFGGGITSKKAEVPGQPTLDSGCHPNEPPSEAQSKPKPVPKVANPPADQAKQKPEAKSANPPADQAKQKPEAKSANPPADQAKQTPAPKIVGSKAHVEYIAPVSGWYFVALQFYGSGVQVILQHKEI
jgi:hypothetical protein